MPHPLDGCFLKLGRASAHLEALKAAARGNTSPKPDHIRGEFDPASGQYLFRAPRDWWPPLELSGIVGDAVHNLFASLDYLVWELAGAHSGKRDRGTAFPIFETEKLYFHPKEGADRKVKYLDPDARACIERAQPFRAPPAQVHPRDHPLTRLRDLEIEDKHHALNLTTYAAEAQLLGLPPPVQTRLSRLLPIPYEQGAVVASLTPGSDWPPLTQLALEVTLRTVVFAPNGPVGGPEGARHPRRNRAARSTGRHPIRAVLLTIPYCARAPRRFHQPAGGPTWLNTA